MRDVLTRRGFPLLVVGQTVSAFGDWMATTGVMAARSLPGGVGPLDGPD